MKNPQQAFQPLGLNHFCATVYLPDMKAMMMTLLCLAGFSLSASAQERDTVINIRNCGSKEYPVFKGDLKQYLKDKRSKTACTEGKVYVQFTIGTKGQVLDPEIKRGLDASCNQEALRLVKAMPPWEPAQDANGIPVEKRMVLPINFSVR